MNEEEILKQEVLRAEEDYLRYLSSTSTSLVEILQIGEELAKAKKALAKWRAEHR